MIGSEQNASERIDAALSAAGCVIHNLGEINRKASNGAEETDRAAIYFDRKTHMLAACEAGLTRSSALRQSILKDALADKLFPQDPAYEPALALLDRIRQKRSA